MPLPPTIESYQFIKIIQEGIAHSSDGSWYRRGDQTVSVRVYVCLSVCLPACLSVYLSVYLSVTVFEPGRDFATLSRFLFECRTKINHPRHHVATKYEMSRV